MEIYPAIDILGGRVVRLLKGDFGSPTIYSDDPVAVARAFEKAGARWIHIVDLDTAKEGGEPDLKVLKKIRDSVGVRIQASGGIRSMEAVSDRLLAGASRVVLGTIAVTDRLLTDEILSRFRCEVAIGLDARGDEVATHGWKNASGVGLLSLAQYYDRPSVSALIVTDIERDGTLAGPAIAQLRSILAKVSVPLIASGGVSGVEDLRTLIRLRAGGRRLAGAVVGRALYEKRFTLEEALVVR